MEGASKSLGMEGVSMNLGMAVGVCSGSGPRVVVVLAGTWREETGQPSRFKDDSRS